MKLKTLLGNSYISTVALICVMVKNKWGLQGHIARRILRGHNHCMTCEHMDKFEEGAGFYCCCDADIRMQFAVALGYGRYGKKTS